MNIQNNESHGINIYDTHGTQKIMVGHDKYWCHKFKTHKNLRCHKKSWIAIKICDNLLPNGMPCHHHMEDYVE
jgi:hypothetical protein